MAPSVLQTAQIFEDPEPQQRRGRSQYSRGATAADALWGRRKENVSPTKAQKLSAEASASPLGERHVNSPPPPKRVATKTGDEVRQSSRPTHKKTGSSVSLKGFLLGKDKAADAGSDPASDKQTPEPKPKKSKSATNLSSLLKKKSKKDLKEEGQPPVPSSPTKPAGTSPTPIWAQFATQPLESPDGTMIYPPSKRRTAAEEINLYTPKDYSEYRPAEQRNFYGYSPALPSPVDIQPPQRPFLEHKTSRSSIFSEHIDDEPLPELSRPKSRDQSASRPNSSRTPGGYAPAETPSSDSPQTDLKSKRGSRVLEAIQNFNMKSRRDKPTKESTTNVTPPMSPQELDVAFEKVLDDLNIPLNMRDNMRNLKPDVKAGLMKGDRVGSGSSTGSNSKQSGELRPSASSPRKKESDVPAGQVEDDKDDKRSRSRSRPRSRILTLSKRGEESPSKQEKRESSRSRSKTRNKSADMSSRPMSRNIPSSVSLGSLNPADCAATPGDFIHYLREVQKPELVDVSKIHKLRILLRNESVTWTDHFVTKGGMDELLQLFYRINKIEWREEHEDLLLHETLLCLKGLCTTSLALQRLESVETEFFPALLGMLFDPERRGPSEFTTRGVIASLVFAHLSAVVGESGDRVQQRVQTVLGFLKDPEPADGKQPLDFVTQMHVRRPYRVWCKEVNNVTKEVFWIFLHHLNVVPILEVDESMGYAKAHYPALRPPHPAAPYVGGVEWEATQYLATQLDILNAVIALIPTAAERNGLRQDLQNSGWERVMGGSLRTCKEKFYSGVHEGLKCWVAAARADGWYVEDVRAGPPRETLSPRKSPVKKKGDEPPQLELKVGGERSALSQADDGWL